MSVAIIVILVVVGLILVLLAALQVRKPARAAKATGIARSTATAHTTDPAGDRSPDTATAWPRPV